MGLELNALHSARDHKCNGSFECGLRQQNIYEPRRPNHWPHTLPTKRCKTCIIAKVVSTKTICPAISFRYQIAGNQIFQIWRHSQSIVVFVIPVAWLLSIGRCGSAFQVTGVFCNTAIAAWFLHWQGCACSKTDCTI